MALLTIQDEVNKLKISSSFQPSTSVIVQISLVNLLSRCFKCIKH